MATDRLIRETNPPTGRIASPVPQYKNRTTGVYEDAEGSDGAILTETLTTKIADLYTLLTRFGEVQASPTANTLLERVKVIKTELDALQTQIGNTDAGIVEAGAVGSLSAKLRRLTTDLGTLIGKDFATQTTLAALKTNFDANVAMETYGNGVPGAHAGEVVGALYLDVTNGDIYASTGAAWVLKVEGIWD